MRWIVEGDALDRDDVGCEVEISELEAEQLFAAVSAEDCQHEKDHIAQRLTVKRVEERLCLFYGEDLLLTLGSTIREQGFSLATPIRKA